MKFSAIQYLVLKTILLLLIVSGSEALFFSFPQKVLFDFFGSIKEKKEAILKKPRDDVHHVHLHYYPVPVSVVFDEHHKSPPAKHGWDHIHSEQLESSGWTDEEYKHGPESKLKLSTKHKSLGGPWIDHHAIQDSDVSPPSDHFELPAATKHILEKPPHHPKPHGVEPRHLPQFALHLPFHQEIILRTPPTAAPKVEKKLHPFVAFFQKLQNIKNSLFSFHEEKSELLKPCDDKIEKPAPISITSNLKIANAYALLYHPKNHRKH